MPGKEDTSNLKVQNLKHNRQANDDAYNALRSRLQQTRDNDFSHIDGFMFKNIKSISFIGKYISFDFIIAKTTILFILNN